MSHAWAQAVEVVTTVLAVAGMGYYVAALLAAFVFLGQRRARAAGARPGVSLLKSLKGLDPGMLEAFRTPLPAGLRGRLRAAVWGGVKG